MVEFLVHTTLSNFVVAFLLASFALLVQQRFRAPALSHLLWAIVLIKLITPPLFSIPVLELPNAANGILLQNDKLAEATPPISQASAFTEGNLTDLSGFLSRAESTASDSAFVAAMMPCIIAAIYSWAIFSGILCFVSAIRIIRFHRLLDSNSSIHQDLSSRLSAQVARRLGMRLHPKILVMRADIAPFVWWMAGRSVIVIPSHAVEELSSNDLQLVVTHEMAHIRRRDHWFRWIEWVAVVFMWWNPLMWWARNQLRASEEMACDDLVLETTTSEPYLYGNALLNMAELLTTTAIGYAVYQGQKVFEALAHRMDSKPELQVELFLNISRGDGDTTKSEILVSRYVERFKSHQWPKGSRLPTVYYDPRSVSDDIPIRSSLHAKCVVVDESDVFVSSANFTEAGQERNIEVGLRLDNSWLARKLVEHFKRMAETGQFRRAI